MGNGRTGIAGGRRQNRYRFVAADVGQHLRHKAATEVFKRQGWTMEQLKAADIRLNLLNRCRESERCTHALFQQLLRDFIADKGRENFSAAGDKVLLQQFINVGQLKFRQVMGEEQPLIFAQSLSHRLREADLLVMIFKVVEFHSLSQYSCASRVQTANMNKAFLILQVVFREPVRHALRRVWLIAQGEQRRAGAGDTARQGAGIH